MVDPPSVQDEHAEVCIVGAGFTGLNALAVASRYLSRNQKVILVDRRHQAGGMWIDTYPYVRLHQPHRYFTAGDIDWRLDAAPSYLANKDEVLDHLGHCLDVVRERVRLITYFGWECHSCDEVDGRVRIVIRSADGRRRRISARRLIKAYGCRIIPNEPLPISSNKVNSVSPDMCDIDSPQLKATDSPVWVIGGGKTAMDTAHGLITEYPGREINLVNGSGSYFLNRDQMFPTGIRRWWSGKEPVRMWTQVARRFDGRNETEMLTQFRDRRCLSLLPEPENFLFSFLSEREAKTIAEGLTAIVSGRFVDVVDDGPVPELVLDSGSTRPIPPGSWIINCTGYLLARAHTYEPYVSANGAILSIQQRSATIQPTGFQAYFMTHLMFQDLLRQAPLYEFDIEEMRRKSKRVLPYALMALNQHNLSVIADLLPAKVFLDCGLDLSRWYPIPRRVAGAAHFLAKHRRDRRHHRRTLDIVRERFDVRCRQLV